MKKTIAGTIMKLEKERSSIRITYLSDSAPEELRKGFEELCAAVDGIYLPSDVQKSKEGIVINVRHRESLKTFLGKNIFRTDDFILLLKRIKKYYGSISGAGYDPSGCVWDVDAVFIGNGIDDMEVIYPLGSSEPKDGSNLLTDFLAIVSLHVFDSRDSAINALSDVIRDFAEYEKSSPDKIFPPSLFDRSVNALDAFSTGSGRVRQYVQRAVGYVTDLSEKLKKQKAAVRIGRDRKRVLRPVSDPRIRPGIPGWLEQRVVRVPALPETAPTLVHTGDVIKETFKETAREESVYRIPAGREYAEELFRKRCPYVSREHSSISFNGRIYTLSDDGSLNGTFLNGELITRGLNYRLEKGDVVSLGHRELSFSFCP